MIAQHIADGILTGAIFALGAIGVTLTLGILRFANFAHAELMTWGAYMALLFVGLFAGLGGPFVPLSFGWPLVLAMLAAMALTALLALLLDALVYAPLRRRGAAMMTLVFASFGVGLLVRHVILILFGPQPEYFSRALQIARPILPGVRVRPDEIVVLVLTLVLVVLVHLFLKRSRMGIAMRAVAESPELARVNGIDVDQVVHLTWIVGGALAAMGGIFYGLVIQLRPELGFHLILPLFAAALVGGAGNVYGAVLGGFIVGLAESMAVLVIPAGYKPAIPFLLLILILYVRPRGLFGGN
jgi:branched-chain amino acid transport system permease protein